VVNSTCAEHRQHRVHSLSPDLFCTHGASADGIELVSIYFGEPLSGLVINE
jgi:hypothetical protein